jgi:hypothetical protein
MMTAQGTRWMGLISGAEEDGGGTRGEEGQRRVCGVDNAKRLPLCLSAYTVALALDLPLCLSVCLSVFL